MKFEEKYKDRTPKETIEIINNFFANRGFSIKKSHIPSNINTHSYGIELYYKDYYITSSNGKGMTEEFALASGMGELYERFCNLSQVWISYLFFNKALEINKDKPYSIMEGDKKLSVDEIYNSDIMSKFLFQNMIKDVRKDFIGKMFEGNFVALPYKNIFTDETIYLNETFLEEVDGSNGSAAGNSFKEAFNQAFSELCERRVQNTFLIDKFENYKCISLDSIKEPSIRKIIDICKNDGIDLYIFDCYQTCNAPVIMLLMVMKNTKRMVVNFGSFPVFEIALERCFTEITQNYESVLAAYDKEYSMPFKEKMNSDEREAIVRGCFRNANAFNSFNEKIFEKIIYEDEPDSRFLRSKDGPNNDEIFNYLTNYIKENKYDVFVCDHSLCDEMKAIRLVIKNTDQLFKPEWTRWYHVENNYRILFANKKFIEMLDTIRKDYDFEKFYSILSDKEYSVNNSAFGDEMDGLLYMRTSLYPIVPEELGRPLTIANAIIYGNEAVKKENFLSSNEKLFNKYMFLKRYVQCGLYTRDEIKDFGKILKYEFKDEDFNNCVDEKYLTEQIVYKPLWEFYHSEDYEHIVKNSICYGLNPNE